MYLLLSDVYLRNVYLGLTLPMLDLLKVLDKFATGPKEVAMTTLMGHRLEKVDTVMIR